VGVRGAPRCALALAFLRGFRLRGRREGNDLSGQLHNRSTRQVYAARHEDIEARLWGIVQYVLKPRTEQFADDAGEGGQIAEVYFGGEAIAVSRGQQTTSDGDVVMDLEPFFWLVAFRFR
jgi:hypothetical protein